eukprot:m.247456 g.247456  ORF g.247456 m.247456 type:complete len:465 (-) comp15396_c0_seq1:202-1596(-)
MSRRSRLLLVLPAVAFAVLAASQLIARESSPDSSSLQSADRALQTQPDGTDVRAATANETASTELPGITDGALSSPSTPNSETASSDAEENRSAAVSASTPAPAHSAAGDALTTSARIEAAAAIPRSASATTVRPRRRRRKTRKNRALRMRHRKDAETLRAIRIRAQHQRRMAQQVLKLEVPLTDAARAELDGVLQRGREASSCLESTWQNWCSAPNASTVFATMVTGKDEAHVPMALLSVSSFLEQSHPAKVLLIINDGTRAIKEAARLAEDPCICEIMVPRIDGVKLGTLRNLALRLIPSRAVWIQWDDDDYHHPDAIAAQLSVLQKRHAAIVMLKRQMQLDLTLNSTYVWTYPGGIWGTIMMNTSFPRIASLQFRNLAKGEDLAYDDLFWRTPVVEWDNHSEMYFRIIHNSNTWGRDHFQVARRFKRDVWCHGVPAGCRPAAVPYIRTLMAAYRNATGIQS